MLIRTVIVFDLVADAVVDSLVRCIGKGYKRNLDRTGSLPRIDEAYSLCTTLPP